MKSYKQFIKYLHEDGVSVGAGISGGGGPTNVISSNAIAGAPPDSPPVNLKKRNKTVLGTVRRKFKE